MPKGLALYESLIRWSTRDLRLYVLPMDGPTASTLQSLRLPKMEVVNLGTFEMLTSVDRIKWSRTPTEYCWTCASNLAYYVMNWREAPCVTYLDSDLFFFSDPEKIFNLIGPKSIAIVPHRLIPEKRHLIVNGIFNVGWVTFRNDDIGRECLAKWALDCREWCYNRHEDGKFADQKYLDAWPAKYGDALCILDQPKVGAAPWNIGQHVISDGPTIDGERIIFYHYHELQERKDGTFKLTDYALRHEDILNIYEPYFKAYRRAQELAESVHLPI